MKVRKLKINRLVQFRARNRAVQVPEIRLSGKWLLDKGFEQGKNVTVTVQNKKLIITLDEKS